MIRGAKDKNVLIEINSSSFTYSRSGSALNCVRMELVDQLDWLDWLDWKVTFASDAHIAYDVNNKKGWLTGDVLSCKQRVNVFHCVAKIFIQSF